MCGQGGEGSERGGGDEAGSGDDGWAGGGEVLSDDGDPSGAEVARGPVEHEVVSDAEGGREPVRLELFGGEAPAAEDLGAAGGVEGTFEGVDLESAVADVGTARGLGVDGEDFHRQTVGAGLAIEVEGGGEGEEVEFLDGEVVGRRNRRPVGATTGTGEETEEEEESEPWHARERMGAGWWVWDVGCGLWGSATGFVLA